MQSKIKTGLGLIIILILVTTIGVFVWQARKKQTGTEENVLPDKTGCIQVISYAEDPQMGECKAFPNPCVVPKGWQSCTKNENINSRS